MASMSDFAAVVAVVTPLVAAGTGAADYLQRRRRIPELRAKIKETLSVLDALSAGDDRYSDARETLENACVAHVKRLGALETREARRDDPDAESGLAIDRLDALRLGRYALACFTAAVGFVFLYFNMNAIQVDSSYSMFDPRYRYVYLVATGIAALPPLALAAAYLSGSRAIVRLVRVALLSIGAALTLFLLYFGLNVTEVGTEFSMFNLGHYWTIYVTAALVTVVPTLVTASALLIQKLGSRRLTQVAANHSSRRETPTAKP